MSEQTREQHETLGGSWSDDPFFGGFVGPGGLYLPSKASSVNANYFSQLVNLYDSIARQLAGVFAGYVYKDSADTNVQCSVKPFTFMYRNMEIVHSGTLALTMTAGQTAFIYADLTAAPAVTILVATAWPTTPHQKLAKIAVPASGPWLPANLTLAHSWETPSPMGSAIYMIAKPFNFNDGVINVATVPVGAIVIPKYILIETAFDGTSPTITVGDAGDPQRLIIAADSDLKTLGKYDVNRHFKFASQTQLTATIVPSASTVGAGYILMEQWA